MPFEEPIPAIYLHVGSVTPHVPAPLHHPHCKDCGLPGHSACFKPVDLLNFLEPKPPLDFNVNKIDHKLPWEKDLWQRDSLFSTIRNYDLE
jgi:hypothetical protein